MEILNNVRNLGESSENLRSESNEDIFISCISALVSSKTAQWWLLGDVLWFFNGWFTYLTFEKLREKFWNLIM